MIKLRPNQYGFSAFEIALFVIVMGLIGGTGAYVYNQNSDNQGTAKNSQASSEADDQSAETEDVDVTKSWYKYTSPNGAYTIRLADGLTVLKAADSSPYHSLLTDDLTVTPGTPAVVMPQDGGRDGPFYGFILNYFANSEEVQVRGTLQDELKTASGLTVKKYYYLETKEFQELGDMNKNDIVYSYVITKGSKKAVKVVYSAANRNADKVELVELMVKSVTIK